MATPSEIACHLKSFLLEGLLRANVKEVDTSPGSTSSKVFALSNLIQACTLSLGSAVFFMVTLYVLLATSAFVGRTKEAKTIEAVVTLAIPLHKLEIFMPLNYEIVTSV